MTCVSSHQDFLVSQLIQSRITSSSFLSLWLILSIQRNPSRSLKMIESPLGYLHWYGVDPVFHLLRELKGRGGV